MSATGSCLETLLSPPAAHSAHGRRRPAPGHFSDALAKARTGASQAHAASGASHASDAAAARLRASQVEASSKGAAQAATAGAASALHREIIV